MATCRRSPRDPGDGNRAATRSVRSDASLNRGLRCACPSAFPGRRWSSCSSPRAAARRPPLPPSRLPDASDAWLRAQTIQAIPPVNLFAVGPTAVITGDGTYVTAGAVPEIYPGPLLPALVGRPISDAGRDAIIAEARRLGLLGRKTDFASVTAMPGGVTGEIVLTVDGAPVTLTGEPDAQIICIMAPCDPVPGTPEAFGELWRRIADPASWLGSRARARGAVRRRRVRDPRRPGARSGSGARRPGPGLAARRAARHVRGAGGQRHLSLRDRRRR